MVVMKIPAHDWYKKSCGTHFEVIATAAATYVKVSALAQDRDGVIGAMPAGRLFAAVKSP
jgi:hypothetical protein